MSSHRWWHDGRGYKHAFCLFCGADYTATTHSETALGSFLELNCPDPRSEGGEEEAQRILARGLHLARAAESNKRLTVILVLETDETSSDLDGLASDDFAGLEAAYGVRVVSVRCAARTV